MLAGFVVDSIFFGRVDVLQTQLVFALYAIICFVTIPLLHWLEVSPVRHTSFSRLRAILPLMTQFALGGFWSGFVVFYGRSAVFGTSWPFLLFLLLVFLGSEYFRQYHARLIFTSILFFFALYSYAIFAVPVYTGTIGTGTFLISGVVAVGAFALFTALLRILARERFLGDVRHIRIGAFVVLVFMNIFYFTNILPPLPLAAKAAGVYHSVWRAPGAYLGVSETGQSWSVRYLGAAPTLHVVQGEPLFAYSSVFAPTTLRTTIVHRWERYDATKKEWVSRTVVSYSISGGRDGGYRGYSTALVGEVGKWRVDIETADGRSIARLPFTVEMAENEPSKTTVTLK